MTHRITDSRWEVYESKYHRVNKNECDTDVGYMESIKLE